MDFNQLLQAAAANTDDTVELKLAANGRTNAMRAYQERPGKQTADDLAAAKGLYAEVTEALWGKYFPGGEEPSGAIFADKRKAHRWYAEQGGILEYSAFTRQKVLVVSGRKVTRESVMALLLKEQHKSGGLGGGDALEAARAEADTRKAIAAADREEYKRDQEQRELSDQWITREEATLETCTWAALTRDAISGRLIKDIPAIIYAAGGDPTHIADVRAAIDRAVTDGCNDIAGSGEVEVDIEGDEE